MRRIALVAAAAVLGAAVPAKLDMAARILPPPAEPRAAVKPYVKHPAGKIAITRVRVIDGTGAPPLEDRTVLLDGARITAILAASGPLPAGYTAIDGRGRSLVPGLVGMHDHLYYIARPNLDDELKSEPPLVVPQMTFSAPRMYLAAGVTTLRTTGSVETYADLNMKRAIDRGELPGPHIDVTGPYIEGPGSPFIQMNNLASAAAARRFVAFWADQGATSFKAYMNVTRAQLKAAIDAAHARGIKVTGHLCSVTYPEAAMLGIDDLEHGFFVNTQLDPGKQPDTCPASDGAPTLAAMTPGSAEANALIALLVRRKVAVTSTLPVFESWSPGYGGLDERQLAVLSPQSRADYARVGDSRQARTPARKAELARMWANAVALERAFVAAGGLLLAGPDPTGGGDVLPGFGNHRALELLVAAGFTPVEAIRVGTLNGATYLGIARRTGSIAVGKNADVVLVRGNPAQDIAALRGVETVFKDGTGYDSAALLTSVKDRYGQY